jgi:hypothetical protein
MQYKCIFHKLKTFKQFCWLLYVKTCDLCNWMKLLGIKLALSMAYHSQTDSQSKQINQELEGYLCMFTSWQQDN